MRLLERSLRGVGKAEALEKRWESAGKALGALNYDDVQRP